MLINQGDVEPGFTRRVVVNVAARLDRDDDGRGGFVVHPSSIAAFPTIGMVGLFRLRTVRDAFLTERERASRPTRRLPRRQR